MSARETVDFGIDLGTTNSAVALFEHGAVQIIKNNDGWDYTPSAVWMPKPGVVHVGRRARERTETDPDNAVAEFKQRMGLAEASTPFARAGISLTAPELSAAVLRSLCADAAHQLGEPPASAVITVPAAFAINQNKATQQAAALAGLGEDCPLLQEPTAAAFAYGFGDEAAERAYWMVFDFGGGTFDAAIVTKRDGELLVLDHAGNPNLGGKDIDWALVGNVLAPAAARELGLRDFERGNPAWRGNFARLKVAAEDAKIQLSRADRVDMLVDLAVGDDGPVSFEYTLTRDELDRVAEPFYDRAIARCRDALVEGGLKPGDIDLLLLVGGTTLAPGLRERLADPQHGLGIPVDHSQDPTTVVARGAAVFAGTVRAPRVVAAPAPGGYTVELHYDPTTTSETPTVAGRLHSGSPVDWTGFGVVLADQTGPLGFRGPRVEVSPNGGFLTEVRMTPGTTSRFVVELTDPAGRPVPLAPDTLTITHVEVEFGGAVLTQSLGIARADRSFAPLVEKGAALPAHGEGTFRTTIALRRGDTDAVIRIPVVEGERPRADRNREVGLIEIRPRDFRIELPLGTEVEVTVDVDASRLVSVTADVPLGDVQFEAVLNLDETRAPDVADLERAHREAERRAENLRVSADAENVPGAARRLDALDGELRDARDQIRDARADPGSALAGDLRVREVQAELDEVEDAVRAPAILRDLDEGIENVADLVAQRGGEDDRRDLDDIRRRADRARAENDLAAAEALLERVRRLTVRLLQAGPEWEVTLFSLLRDMRDDLEPRGQADRLIAEGERAIAAGDQQGLASVNARLRRLIPPDTPDPTAGGGLTGGPR
ncbi:Hsp70 family protein [Actinomycetospora aeridis]|uniref:Hsp70 family protein n=1 Tax=Actinomycetospora aeridis TaxID=3129231 RepID=A0ABU8MZ88_9PSEU